jgi:hypothetical protein
VGRVVALLVLVLAGCRSGSLPVPEAHADPARASGGVAVVELFTSEGCSSCPPADRVLADLAASGDSAVFPLAFHVDYWDDLGWRDRFDSAENTERQRAYAGAFRAAQVYTPQMVVNGVEQFTGSDRSRATRAITAALAAPASVALHVRAHDLDASGVTVDYEAPGAPAGALLTVAVVEHAATSAVASGENSGKTLRHANVVRGFRVVPLAAPTGSARIAVHAPTDGEVIAFVQRPRDGEGMPVIGAARAPLPRR